MLHNLKNFPLRQSHLLKRTKRENTLMISLICLKCWMDVLLCQWVWGVLQQMLKKSRKCQHHSTFNLGNASWLPPSTSMTQRPESHDSWQSTRHGCADGVQPHAVLQTQRLLLLLPGWVSPLTALTLPYQKRCEEDPGPTWCGFPPFQERTVASSLIRNSCHARVVDGECKVAASQLTYLNVSCIRQSLYQLNNILPRGFSSIETPPLFSQNHL